MRTLAPLSAYAHTHTSPRCTLSRRCQFQLALLRTTPLGTAPTASASLQLGSAAESHPSAVTPSTDAFTDAFTDTPAASQLSGGSVPLWVSSPAYLELAANLSALAAHLFDAPADSTRRLVKAQFGASGIGAQHVRTLAHPRATPVVSEVLERIETRFLLPYLESIFGGRAELANVKVRACEAAVASGQTAPLVRLNRNPHMLHEACPGLLRPPHLAVYFAGLAQRVHRA